MKICRYNDDRIGVVTSSFEVVEVTQALDGLPALKWPVPLGDIFIENLQKLMPKFKKLASQNKPVPLSSITLKSPVANPSKIIGAPINYQKHIDESVSDDGIVSSRPISHISDWGMFLKANSALVGAGEGVALRFTEARNDHEVELAVIIGKKGSKISNKDAKSYIAGYAIGLDMTTRGKELQSFRKSADSYAVLGPWLVTADEIPNPNELDLSISVNGEERQSSNTRELVYDVEKLIEYTSERYTLYPGDIIMTGTPDGVGPVEPGDVMLCKLENVGEMEVNIKLA
ncbi:MAG: fumarylacetoacetate hydrolase family protein [Pseudomonadota bacterium]|nr:fumarylacetoacetate hydrolase family protein [Pseudomonadota bacterium]